jgi:hypothetical protein
MSLTSYRAAPPRIKLVEVIAKGRDMSAIVHGRPQAGISVAGDLVLATRFKSLAATYSPMP